MRPAKSVTLLFLAYLMTLLAPAPPAEAQLRGTFTFTLTEGGAAKSMTCFARQDDNDAAVLCESAATTGTCGMTVTTLRGEVKSGRKTFILTGTTPVRNADCSLQGIECLKMTLAMTGPATVAGNGIRRLCTAGSDSSFTVAASRTSFLSMDRDRDLDRNSTPELLWVDLFARRYYAWYMDGKKVLRERILYGAPGIRFVTTADFNSDGKPDLLLRDYGRNEVSVVMQKDSAFKTENKVVALKIEGHRAVAGAGDFDSDGDPDLVFQNVDSGEIFVVYWNGSRFADVRKIGTVDNRAWRAVGVGDFSFDNRPDILLHNEATGAVAVWLLNDTNILGVKSLGSADPLWHAHAVQDMNTDGHPDIIWRNNSSGDVAIWYMNRTHPVIKETLATVGDHNKQLAGGLAYTNSPGSIHQNRILWRYQVTGGLAAWLIAGTTFQSVSYIPNTQPIPSLSDLNWRLAATGDVNGDHLSDILWQNEVTGRVAVWYMQGDTVLFSQELPPVADASWKIVAACDFDDDVHTDILLHQPSTGGLRLLLMNGVSIVKQVSLVGVAKGWRVGGVAYAGPGRRDIYFQEISTGRVVVWHMNGTHRESSRAVSTPGDRNWVLVGVHEFSGASSPDLLVLNEATGEAAVWLMYTSESVWAVRRIGTAANLNWKITGVCGMWY